MRSLAVMGILLCALAPVAGAQTPSRAIGVTFSRSVGSGSAAHPPPCPPLCMASDVLAPVAVTMLELELAVPLRGARRSGLEYQLRAVPFAYVQENPTDPAVRSTNGWALPTTTSRSSTIGLGLKPVGLRGWLGSDEVRFESDLLAGLLWFSSPLFAANGARLNFTYELGLGVRFSRAGRGGWSMGYRRHHVSNAGMGDVNPGLNSHMFYVGVPVT